MIAATVLALLTQAPTAAAAHPVEGWSGCWSDGSTTLLLDGERAARLDETGATFFRTRLEGNVLLTEQSCRFARWELELEPDVLHVRFDPGSPVLDLHPIDRVPEELSVPPYPTAGTPQLAPDGIAAIAERLSELVDEDQAVRREAQGGEFTEELRARMARIDEASTAYLLELLPEVGYPDETRFGEQAAGDAFLLAQHSADLRLQRTALAVIQDQVRPGRRDGQEFALLHDRLQLRLGYRQRYGSQLAQLEDGSLVVCTLEDPAAVDDLRAGLGMTSLGDYLALFGDVEQIRIGNDLWAAELARSTGAR